MTTRLRFLPLACIALALSVFMLLRDRLAAAEDAGAAGAAAELAAVVDAGVAAPTAMTAPDPAAPGASAPAAATAPQPGDPLAAPGDAIDGVRLWWRTGWAYGVAFVLGSILIGVSARWRALQKGKLAIGVGTAIAAITVVLGAKATGATDATSVAAAMNVLIAGIWWMLKPNKSTIDLSTATPQQIAAALAAADKPPAFPAGTPGAAL